MRAVWNQPHPDPATQLVLVAVAWRTTPGNGTAEVSYSTLADMTGMSRAKVGRALARAVADTYLELVWARPGRRSRYRLNLGEYRVTPQLVGFTGAGTPPPSQPSLPGIGDNPGGQEPLPGLGDNETPAAGEWSTGGPTGGPQVDNSQPAYLGERGFGDDKKKKRKGPDNRVLVENEV